MDKIDGMQAFVSVARLGSFTAAADRLALSPQLVSKYVSQLESQLNTRLLNRTTRKVHLTEAGERYFQRAQQLLIDIEEMETQLTDMQTEARGQLRISAPVSFSTQHLAPLLHDFRRANPGVTIELQLNDRKVDIVDEGFDVALRIGRLKSSSMIAKKIAPVRLVMTASPEYLKQYGQPTTPEELKGHRYLRYSYLESDSSLPHDEWLRQGERQPVLVCNNGDILTQAAIAGDGIALQPTFICGEALASGTLVQLMPEYEPEPMGLYAVYVHRQLMASKVRAFIDFIDGYFGAPPYWDSF